MPIYIQGCLTLAAILLAFYAIKSFLSLAPWVPMLQRDLARLARVLDIRPGEIFFDLGSGDGRAVFFLARREPRAKAVGIELFWPLHLYARAKGLLGGPANALFSWKDALKTDLSAADAVFLFAMPDSLAGRIKSKLASELKPGSRIATYSFAMPGWTPAKVDKPSDKDLAIYLYKI